MRWFRDTISQSTWLALIALAINLGLSFGHFHAIDSKASEHAIAAMAADCTNRIGPSQLFKFLHLTADRRHLLMQQLDRSEDDDPADSVAHSEVVL